MYPQCKLFLMPNGEICHIDDNYVQFKNSKGKLRHLFKIPEQKLICPYGNVLACVDKKNNFSFYDLEGNKLATTFNLQKVTAVTAGNDNTLLIGHGNGKLSIFNPKENTLQTIDTQLKTIQHLRILQNGQLVMASDDQLQLFNFATFESKDIAFKSEGSKPTIQKLITAGNIIAIIRSDALAMSFTAALQPIAFPDKSSAIQFAYDKQSDNYFLLVATSDSIQVYLYKKYEQPTLVKEQFIKDTIKHMLLGLDQTLITEYKTIDLEGIDFDETALKSFKKACTPPPDTNTQKTENLLKKKQSVHVENKCPPAPKQSMNLGKEPSAPFETEEKSISYNQNHQNIYPNLYSLFQQQEEEEYNDQLGPVYN